MTTYQKPRTPEEERIKKEILAYLVETNRWCSIIEITGEWGRPWNRKRYNTDEQPMTKDWCNDLLGDLMADHLVEASDISGEWDRFKAAPGSTK